MLESLHPVIRCAPSRLSPETVSLAKRYLDGEFKGTIVNASFRFPAEETDGLSDNMKYALTIKLAGENAPLRILPEERLAGAATLLESVWHATPGCDYPGTSHTTVGFGSVLKSGYRGLREKIHERLADKELSEEQKDFLLSTLVCLEGAAAWHNRHIAGLDRMISALSGAERGRLAGVRLALERVPEEPPQDFREAIQSLWFMFSFLRLCGIWSGLGRFDEMLGPFLERDLADGIITAGEARELIAHFWIKGSEWRGATGVGSGDAQFYQNVILGGEGPDGKDVTNIVSYLVLDVVEELHISDYPVAVRVNSKTEEKMWRRIAELQTLGGGIVSIYNEDMVIRALTRFGFPREDAVSFTNDGCWEAIIGGKTAFTYLPFDSLQILQSALGLDKPDEARDFESFEDLYQDFLCRLAHACRKNDEAAARHFQSESRNGLNKIPVPLVSLFVSDCIGRARSYNNRGAEYNVAAIHAGGLPDTANSLFVIKKIVYDERRLSFADLRRALIDNWAGREPLRLCVSRDYALYGNDSPEADSMLVRVVADYARIAGETREINGVLRPVGISTFGREITYSKQRMATAFGRKAGDCLAGNLAPTPGTDLNGPTAVIKSFCKVDFSAVPNGCPLDLKLGASAVKGENGVSAIVEMLKTFVRMGGFYAQIDVVDNQVLLDAQANPGKYPNLVVRISGWSARFDTLTREWQDMVINRCEHKF